MPFSRTLLLALLLGSASFSVSAAESCSFGQVSFRTDFASGRLNGCEQSGKTSYTLHLRPENQPINPSPWYAFQVVNNTAEVQAITVTLVSHNGPARYEPKASIDKQVWAPVAFSKTDNRMQFKLQLADSPLFIAGGEIIDNISYTRWLSDIAHGDIISIGSSTQGRSIAALEHRANSSNDWLILIGRQHPPEISGALGLLHFNNLLWSDDADMQAFRARYNILLVPNMNPDGVHAGNWRHNANGLDLNRDWKNRTQAETQALHAKLTAIEAEGGKIRFALDFHSTWRNVYYTMTHDYITVAGIGLENPQLVNNWLADLALAVPFEVENKPSHNQNSGVFKQYMADQFGVHSVTYEVGDTTDRNEIRSTAEAALRTLIRHL
jgi:cytosolic carboxypeptidase protein 6